jgi:hypothetical protein
MYNHSGLEKSNELPRSTRLFLFTPESPSEQTLSPKLSIAPGDVVFITAYNMPEDRKIYIRQVTIATYNPPSSQECCGNAALPWRDGIDVHYVRMSLGGVDKWVFTSDNPQKIISLPGTYRLELEDEDMLGQSLQVEYYKWPLTQTPGVPLVI